MSTSVAIVTGGRGSFAVGLHNAETRLFQTLAERERADAMSVSVRVMGGRSARRYASHLGARWVPARPGSPSSRAWKKADLIHLAGLDFPPPVHTPFVATFQDLAALAFPDEGQLPDWAQEIAERAVFLVCPSEFTASELNQRLGVASERIRVVPYGPGCAVSVDTPLLDATERTLIGVPNRYVLRLGGYTIRKNVGQLLEAWSRVPTDTTLVLAGPPQLARDEVLRAAPSLDRVHVLDYLPPSIVPRLIRSAEAVVTTSLYEGFGLTPLEGMCAGVPTVAVRSEAAIEVCGDAALLVDDDPDLLASAIAHAISDEETRSRLAEAGPRRAADFSWNRSGVLLRAVYRQALDASAS